MNNLEELNVALLIEKGKVVDLEKRLNEAMILQLRVTGENAALKEKNEEL